MKKIILVLTLSTTILSVTAQIKLPGGNLGNTLNNAANTATGAGANLSESDIAKGLKEALDVGTKNAVGAVSKTDGFFKNPKVKIPFPPKLKKLKHR
jgi:hypothetical protein